MNTKLTSKLTLVFEYLEKDQISSDQVKEIEEETGTEFSDNQSAFQIRFEVETTDREGNPLTIDDLFPDDPEDYLKNGPMAGIIEQLVRGIGRERGISLREAISDACEKADNARNIIYLEGLKQMIGEATLALCEHEGEA